MGEKKVAVLVAGSWGTALASVLADNGLDVLLWTRHPEQAEEINKQHRNDHFLKDTVLSEGIRATLSMEEAVTGARMVVMLAPSAAVIDVASQL